MSKIIGYQIKTPWVPMSVLVDTAQKPTVIAAAFLEMPKLLKKTKAKISISDFKKDSKLAGVTEIINDWIDGDLNAFSKIKVRQPGGDFIQDCWTELRKVKGGSVVSYAQLASKAGRPKAVRAAGTACATNLIAPIIPCHRVIKTGGQLGNYGFGLQLKAALLRHEGVDL